jgi:hypothetical protein
VEGITEHHIRPNRFYVSGEVGFDVSLMLHPGDTCLAGTETCQLIVVRFPGDVDWEIVVLRIN